MYRMYDMVIPIPVINTFQNTGWTLTWEDGNSMKKIFFKKDKNNLT